jgi:hypothetical protein
LGSRVDPCVVIVLRRCLGFDTVVIVALGVAVLGHTVRRIVDLQAVGTTDGESDEENRKS